MYTPEDYHDLKSLNSTNSSTISCQTRPRQCASVSASVMIQALPVCLCESAVFWNDICQVGLVQYCVHSSPIFQCFWAAGRTRCTSLIQRTYGESSTLGVHCTSLLWEFSLRCFTLKAPDLNLGFSSSIRSDHRGLHGIISLKPNKHLSTSKQIPRAFNKNIHTTVEELRPRVVEEDAALKLTATITTKTDQKSKL